MRTKEDTIRLCKTLFTTSDDIRILTRLCKNQELKQQFFNWWRSKQHSLEIDGISIIDAADLFGEAEDQSYDGQDVVKLGPCNKGYFYYIDRENNEIVKRIRNCIPKQKIEKTGEAVGEEIWYSLFQNISKRFKYLCSMEYRFMLLEEISGISSRKAEKNMRMFFDILSVLGYVEPDAVTAIMNARTGTSQSSEKQELFVSSVYGLPFGLRKPINTDVAVARKILDERLYNLQEVKEQIIEYIVLMIHSQMRGATVPLLLVGPPGIGKTSIGRAIADALRLPFHSFNLGGLNDTAIFRGHHSSWSESTPGSIVRMLTNCQCENPVVLLDEIDKAGASSYGSIQDMVSELVDPSTNHRFVDSYLGFPVDLSKCLFILTANDIEKIPEYLIDRCEVIRIQQYTPDERAHIIQFYLIDQVLTENYLQYKVNIEKETVDRLSLVQSLREVKRIIRSAIAKVLSTLSVEEAGDILLDNSFIEIKNPTAKPFMGFTAKKS